MLKLIRQNKTVHMVNIQQVISSLRMGNDVCERKTKEQSDENNKITYLAGRNFRKRSLSHRVSLISAPAHGHSLAQAICEASLKFLATLKANPNALSI